MSQMPPFVVLDLRVFYQEFVTDTQAALCSQDQQETLRQLFDALINEGFKASKLQSSAMFLDLNRMRNTQWHTDKAFEMFWRDRAQAMGNRLIAYANQHQLFGADGTLDYGVFRIDNQSVTLNHIPL